MAIRYKGFEFDTVDEAIEFNRKKDDEVMTMEGYPFSEEETVKVEQLQEEVLKPTPKKRRGRPKKRSGKGWSEKDEDFVIEFYRRNTIGGRLKRGKIAELVVTLGRTEKAIQKRVTELKAQGKMTYLDEEKTSSKAKPKAKNTGKGGVKPGTKRGPYKKKNENKRWTAAEDKVILNYHEMYAGESGRLPAKKMVKLAKILKRPHRSISDRKYALMKQG